jgi:uncharacterized protein
VGRQAAGLTKAPSSRLLLDVNIWIALLDDAHVHNTAALALFALPGLKIATCPLVENGVLRILNLPSYSPNGQGGPAGFEAVRSKMRLACGDTDHEFWPDGISLVSEDIADWTRVFGHGQITDLYLLALAVARGGALATFDHRVALGAVNGAQAGHLVLL